MKIKPNIAISEDGFLFDPETGESFSMNDTAKDIVELIKDEKTEDEIIEIMTQNYDIDKSNFERYYIDFIAMLKHLHIIQQ